MTRFPRFAVLCALGAMLAFPAGSATAEAPTATVSKSCSVGDSRSYGTTYVLKISTRNVTCRKARRVVRAFHACRPGKAGRCGRRVLRFRCSENRFNSTSTQYDSRVTCRRGGKRVWHTYTQWR